TRSKRDWSSDVCSSDLKHKNPGRGAPLPGSFLSSGFLNDSVIGLSCQVVLHRDKAILSLINRLGRNIPARIDLKVGIQLFPHLYQVFISALGYGQYGFLHISPPPYQGEFLQLTGFPVCQPALTFLSLKDSHVQTFNGISIQSHTTIARGI